MQLTAAVPGSGSVPASVMPTVPPVLALLIPDGGAGKPCASRKDPVPVSPATLPEPTDPQIQEPRPAPAPKSLPVAPQKIIRTRSASVSRRISKSNPFVEQDIPLYLVPHIIARAIWQQGERTFRISVIRTKQHYYTIRLRTARPGIRAGTRPCAKSRSGKNTQGCPGKNPGRKPSPEPSELLMP
ncbi:MAG: hypothetical protein Q7T80_17810 [Methanoregula sp.]|nr:hypothetical protein [Methanoregula sp.]